MKSKKNMVHILLAVVVILLVIVSFAGGVYSTILLVNRDINNLMGENAAVADENMTYQERIEELTQKLDEAEANNNILSDNVDALQAENSQLGEKPTVTFYTPEYVRNGLQINADGSDSIAVINSRAYVAADMLDALVDWPTNYDKDNNVLTLGDEDETITKIDVLDTDILYGGDWMTKYLPSEGKSFAMGGNTYTKGFTIDWSGWVENTGDALFNLEGKYSSISFDIGRLDTVGAGDVTMKIYINDELTETYDILSSTPVKTYNITLNYAQSLKIELNGEGDGYGFANVILNK